MAEAEKAGRRHSIRRRLLLRIAPSLALLIVGALALTNLTLYRLADSAYDRSIAGAIRAIDQNISTAGGGISVELPYPLFESFEATASGNVYFRVTTDDGLVQLGDTILPPPPPVPLGEFRFYNDDGLGYPLRIGAFRRAIRDDPARRTILIEVGETTQSRQQFRLSILRDAGLSYLVIFAAFIVLLYAGVNSATRPLRALRDEVARRPGDDLTPVPTADLPSEIDPLVETFNELLSRHARQAEAQRRFLDTASHQLKTPVAILGTQVDFALRTDDPAARRDALLAMRSVLQRASRMISHFLSLARVRHFNDSGEAGTRKLVALGPLLAETLRMHLPAARRQRVELALEMAEDPPMTRGSDMLLIEAVSNLLDNAIRHSPSGSTVTLSLEEAGDRLAVNVRDEGPGMDADTLSRIGERFATGDSRHGTGLGLALVDAVATAHRGEFICRNRPEGGLSATIFLPKA